MANKIQIKRTSTSGRLPNTTNVSNSSYISAGELALNMADGILYSSNGSSSIVVGSNVVNLNVTGGLKANGSYGTQSFVLTSSGSGIYWAAASGGGSTPYLKYSSNTYLYSFQLAQLDTSNGTFYASLPNTSFVGDWIRLVDGGGDKYTKPVIIARNSFTINDSNDDLVLDIPNFKVELVYTGSTWKVFT